MHRHLRLALPLVLAAASAAAQHPTEWAAYGRDAQGTRYSPLSEIDRGNVARLTVAWTYRTGETEHTHRPAKLETTPLSLAGPRGKLFPIGNYDVRLSEGPGPINATFNDTGGVRVQLNVPAWHE